MIVFATICLILSLLLILSTRSLWNKILATNIAISIVIVIVVLLGMETGISYYYDIGVAFALLSFIGTQFFVRFLVGRGYVL